MEVGLLLVDETEVATDDEAFVVRGVIAAVVDNVVVVVVELKLL